MSHEYFCLSVCPSADRQAGSHDTSSPSMQLTCTAANTHTYTPWHSIAHTTPDRHPTDSKHQTEGGQDTAHGTVMYVRTFTEYIHAASHPSL
mmetsp:Transcript_23216/g.66535  ORF Transcript_23216/g.66535 Transcript_23216/m.66535 type:complete len:92 (-) Transcript_23216:430-705(-)